MLVPVPLHITRLRARGYNQADVLGRILAQRLHLPIYTDILYRTRQTSPQVETKSRNARLRNMDKAFACTDVDVRGKELLLFDDVFTTGATMRSAANVLKRAGVRRVWAVTMAR